MIRNTMHIRLCLAVILLVSNSARAGWVVDGASISTAAQDQANAKIIADGAGGAILAWEDNRNGTNDIYAQRVNALGVPQWTANGVAVCTAPSDQSFLMIVADGAGGVILTWADQRSGTNSDIYAQRVNASGVPQWTANGVALSAAAGNQSSPTIVSDGAAGAIVTWDDLRSGSYDVYAQRVNASGAPQWTANGVALCTAANDQQIPGIVSDGVGGAIVNWDDRRGGANYDVYVQRVNASGAPQWAANGVALCTIRSGAYFDRFPIVSDGFGGAIVTWPDFRSGIMSSDVYAQRVNASGTPQWAANGVALCIAPDFQYFSGIASDGLGGAIVTWADRRNTDYNIYAQRIDVSGAPQWNANGVAVCSAALDQTGDRNSIVADGAGGAIITWSDYRSVTNTSIYAQRVSASGAPQWIADGVALCTAALDRYSPIVVSDGSGGAIFAWNDLRSGTADVYAQRVEGTYGYWGHPEPTLVSVADIPRDQGGKVALNWTASGRDTRVPATIDFYSIWRAVDVSPASASARVVLPLEKVTLDTPLHTVTTVPQSSYYWELIGKQTAYRFSSYSFAAETRADSVAGAAGNTFFMVMAHAMSDAHVAFPSNAVSGHSVDNLAPIAPLALTAQRVGTDVRLKWNRAVAPDLRNYAVYRNTTAGVTAVAGNLLGSSADTVLVDANAPPSPLYYVVTAYDIHANQSAPSKEVRVSATSGVGDTPAITNLTVLPNHPNPFTGTTELEIGLPSRSNVSLDVYDVAGRRVVSRVLPAQKAGWQKIAFDGRDDTGHALPSGVYFFRVSANGETLTRKIVIAR